MTIDEAKNAIEELKSQDLTDEAIAASLYEMFKEDKIDLEQFDALVKLVGYELSDEFKAMSDDEKKSQDVGEFGMSEDDEEDNSSDDEAASNDEQSNDEDNSNNEDEDEEDENPFEKNYDKKSDDDDDEAKKVFNF